MINIESRGINNDCQFALVPGELTLDLDDKVDLVYKRLVMRVRMEHADPVEAEAFIHDLCQLSSDDLHYLIPSLSQGVAHLFSFHKEVMIQGKYSSDEKVKTCFTERNMKSSPKN